jgi:hypothetical protein
MVQIGTGPKVNRFLTFRYVDGIIGEFPSRRLETSEAKSPPGKTRPTLPLASRGRLEQHLPGEGPAIQLPEGDSGGVGPDQANLADSYAAGSRTMTGILREVRFWYSRKAGLFSACLA